MARSIGAGLAGIAVLVLLAACGEADGVSAAPGPSSSSLAGRTFLSTEDVGIPGGGPLEFRFTDDGRLLATAGCNSTNGPVQLDDGRLVSTDLAMTEMGCEPEVMASDQWLGDLLAAEPEWELSDDDGTLVLTAGELVVTMVDRDVLQPPAELGGTRWEINTLIDGELASSMPAGTAAFLVIEGDTISGNAGCNDFSGSVAVDGDTLTFGEITTTDKSCGPDVTQVEEIVHAVLGGEVQFSIDGQQLSLTAESGHGLQANPAP